MTIGWTQWAVGGPGKGQHTHSVYRDTQGGWSHVQGSDTILTHVGVATPLIKSMVSEHREYVVGGGGGRQYHTHTHCVSRDTQGGCNLGHGSDTTLTHVGVAPPTD